MSDVPDELICDKRVDELSVIEAIDRPIRDLVLHINRIGLQTVFSCCGYPYPDEEEPKSHAYKNAYVIFKKPDDTQKFAMFDALTYHAQATNWSVSRYHHHWRIDLKLDKVGNPTRAYYIQDEEDKETYSLHDYELLSIGIWNLTQKVKELPTYQEEVRIVDGNKLYHELGIDWQITPKPDAIITYEERKNDEH